MSMEDACLKNMVLVLHVIDDFNNGLDRHIQKDMDQIVKRI